ncbi:MAG: hypothetical protein QGD90_08970 [Candidatus Hydrogenedentes bacterium]|nr:hypothetical protein [Candidatus Hydrogenedentota bacterium]
MRNFAAMLCVYGLLACLQAPAQQTPATPEPSPQAQRPERRPGPPGAAIGRADANQDGKVSFEELRALRPRMTGEQFSNIDTDGDGFLTPADRPRPQRQRDGQDRIRRRMLTKLLASDRDGDGAVTYEELTKAKPGFPEQNFIRLDTNRDGKLTLQELQKPRSREGRPRRPAGGSRDRAPRPENRRRLIERLMRADANGDGQVTLKEVQQALPGFSEERFRRMDRNGDGALSPGERPQRPSVPRTP